MKRILWSLVYMMTAAGICSAQTTLYFPQIADGLQSDGTAWFTAIAVTNPASTGNATGTITFTQDDGTPFNLAFTDQSDHPVGSGNTIQFQVAGGQTRFFISTAAQSLNVGFAAVTANVPITAVAIFQQAVLTSQGVSIIAQAGVPAASLLARQATFVFKEKTSDTGVAVANPGNSTAAITFQLLDTNGVAAFPPVTATLAAQNHTAKFIHELFPNVSSSFYGTMQITSPTPLVTTSLSFSEDGKFATFPVIPLQ